MRVSGFNHITLNVRSLDTTIEFYVEILGMNLRHRGNKDAYLEWGNAWICIIENSDFNQVTRNHYGMDHIAFYMDERYFEEALKILKNENVTITRGPIVRGTGRTVNFLEPNGIEFELHTATLDDRMKVWK